MLERFFKFINQKGQALIFYGLLSPLLFLAAGAGVDLGWYYMNVSRLQNAADAAVLAGAEELVTNLHTSNDPGGASEYVYYNLVDKVADGFVEVNRDTSTGDRQAKHYASRNLSKSFDWGENNSVEDKWTERDINFKKKFYLPENSSDEDKKYYAYYEVTLTETPNHFFNIFNSFGDMHIQVKSVAELSTIYREGNGGSSGDDDKDHGPDLITQMEKLKGEKVYAQFYEIMDEYIKYRAKIREQLGVEIQSLIDGGMDASAAKAQVEGRWKADFVEQYMAAGRSRADAEKIADAYLSDTVFTTNTSDPAFLQAQDKEIHSSGNFWLADLATYRTEGLTMRGIGGATYTMNQFRADDLFVDFQVDINYDFKSDWDLTETPPKNLSYPNCKIFDSKSDSKNLRYNYRIFGMIDIEPTRDSKVVPKGKYPYRVRNGKYDPLYARIESEQIKRYEINGIAKDFKSYNSVREILINVNVSNTADNERPLVFFYDGPQKYDESSHLRDSKPVILNLNADFKGILYAPNSPVVVAGNGKTFEGFVVAKEFVKLKTAEEFKNEGYTEVVRCQMNLVQAEGDEVIDNTPITDYNSAFNSNKVYVQNKIFVHQNDIIEAENLPTNNPEEIVQNYIAVTYSNVTCYIRRDCEYFEELTTAKVDGREEAYRKIKVPNIIIDSVHGDVQISGKIDAHGEYGEIARDNDKGDMVFKASDFELASSTYNSFNLVHFVNYKYLNKVGGTDNMFETERGRHVD